MSTQSLSTDTEEKTHQGVSLKVGSTVTNKIWDQPILF